jgi:uncharacterized membrane protein
MKKSTLKRVVQEAQVVLIAALILFALYLTYTSVTTNAICIVDNQNSCQTVQDSQYGKLFGIKLTYLGVIAFVFLFGFHILARLEHKYQKRSYQAFIASTIIGALFATYLIYIQLFVVKQICTNCIIVDSIMILVTLLAVLDYSLEL